MLLSAPFSERIKFPLSNFAFFFADPEPSLALLGSRNVRRFCCRAEARRLPVAVAGGEVRRLPEIVTRSMKWDDGGGRDGV